MKILVTGALSGLGLYLQKLLNADALTRKTSLKQVVGNKKYDVIIHCAANSNIGYDDLSIAKFVEDNIILTQRLLEIPHGYFIFISSVNVYPDRVDCSEDLNINLSDLQDGYSIAKLMSESLVQASSKNVLILRPTAMLGAYSRPNSLIKLFTDNPSQLSLSANSIFNYILHEDVGKFIKGCIEKRICGIFNLASLDNVILSDIVKKYHLKNITFGEHTYKTGKINTSKAMIENPIFSKTSMQVVDYYLNYIRSVK